MSILIDQLKMLEAKHKPMPQPKKRSPRLAVYYGWSKLNKIQKREALAVFFLNSEIIPPRIDRGHGYDGVDKYMDVAYKRWQTEGEAKDAAKCNRIYTVYYIFMDDKRIGGNLSRALEQNWLDDRKNVSENEREKIREALRNMWMAKHPDYKEARAVQLELKFE